MVNELHSVLVTGWRDEVGVVMLGDDPNPESTLPTPAVPAGFLTAPLRDGRKNFSLRRWPGVFLGTGGGAAT